MQCIGNNNALVPPVFVCAAGTMASMSTLVPMERTALLSKR
jgi:hypothetical protein